ncbi:two-component system nitrogen regulation sensor histidine kinase NtrY [Pacificibacter maritimus]|uniref:histidine kinase n=1 Tax=Pacificibacter maritimus TaxID=762213 RepID=A0A3N4V2R8_9RHOB|nr:PAS domain-containing sensor histidine kinase [Pacificibacter maritimus]RPE71397.1 two-component system nitrogen regulation sensor histidine kinase NtrY [Pacificibacter maritimus]
MRLRRLRQLQNWTTLFLFVAGPILAIATFVVIGPLDQITSTSGLRAVLLADLIYVILVAGLIAQRIVKIVAARRAHSAGSQLHLRLTGVFVLLALIPTVTVAVFAVVTLNFGLEGWFSDRVRNVVGSSLSAAEAYEGEHRDGLSADTRSLANYIVERRRSVTILPDGALREVLNTGQGLIQRGLREAFVIDKTGTIRARGERSYLFDYEPPNARQLARAEVGELVLIDDWDANESRALLRLSGFADRYLYVTRDVDGAILNLLDETQETIALYNQLENDRGRLLFEFGLIYLGFALILILAATWVGLRFSEGLARPIGRLVEASNRVKNGDLTARVAEEATEDEVAVLGRVFNQMTEELNVQRDTLLERSAHIETRRRLFDSVLGSVTAGVIALDPDGHISLLNPSAEGLLSVVSNDVIDVPLSVAVPEFGPLFETLQEQGREVVQDELRLIRPQAQENLLVRIAQRRDVDGVLEGYVVAFDDVTDLVSAQRMAAWGDVARRIAHEIKNPLTPIQLSAERISRKFGKGMSEDDRAALDQYTSVIVRQTGDLRRIVDEFSKFARMPTPELRELDLVELVQGAVLLQRNAQMGVRIDTQIDVPKAIVDVDGTMIGQALTNLIKNAGEAIESLDKNDLSKEYDPRILVTMSRADDQVVITITDNGIGLPKDRARLFEPYVTTRDKGTGLGLPIVKKIIDEHGGSLTLSDGEPLDSSGRVGACATVRLDLAVPKLNQLKQKLAV